MFRLHGSSCAAKLQSVTDGVIFLPQGIWTETVTVISKESLLCVENVVFVAYSLAHRRIYESTRKNGEMIVLHRLILKAIATLTEEKAKPVN